MVRCINLAKKKHIPQRRAGLAERTRTGAGGTVVMCSNAAWSLNFFSFFYFSKCFGGLVAGTRSAKFPVPVPGL